MPDRSFLELNKLLGDHYTELLRKHGDSHLTAQYSDRLTQELRFAALADIGLPPRAKILDFGCGLGDLLAFLRTKRGFEGEYTGYDLSRDIVERARQKYQSDGKALFEVRDIFLDPPQDQFDYIFICGTFNIKGENCARYVKHTLGRLFQLARRAIAFNLMSTYVDYFDPGLYYADPGEMFKFCKETLSPCVALRHDYLLKDNVIPFEFAMYVYHSQLPLTLNRTS